MSGHRLSPLVASIAVAAVLLAGCGSSKPAYCSKISDLKKSVQDLRSVTSLNGLKTQLNAIDNKAKDVADAAKSDFPTEATAITTSVHALRTAVEQLPQSPSAGELATVAKQASATATALKGFASATSSKCG